MKKKIKRKVVCVFAKNVKMPFGLKRLRRRNKEKWDLN